MTVFIYWRTEVNNTDYDSIPNPTNLPSGQKLEFNTADDILETVSMHYENNIKDSSVSNADGKRSIAKQDNGLGGIVWTFRGRFKDITSDLEKLLLFARIQQLESSNQTNALSHGKFGFYTDNTVLKPFNLDPRVTTIGMAPYKQGLTLRSFDITRTGQIPKNFDFTIVMTFGGDYIGNN